MEAHNADAQMVIAILNTVDTHITLDYDACAFELFSGFLPAQRRVVALLSPVH